LVELVETSVTEKLVIVDDSVKQLKLT